MRTIVRAQVRQAVVSLVLGMNLFIPTTLVRSAEITPEDLYAVFIENYSKNSLYGAQSLFVRVARDPKYREKIKEIIAKSSGLRGPSEVGHKMLKEYIHGLEEHFGEKDLNVFLGGAYDEFIKSFTEIKDEIDPKKPKGKMTEAQRWNVAKEQALAEFGLPINLEIEEVKRLLDSVQLNRGFDPIKVKRGFEFIAAAKEVGLPESIFIPRVLEYMRDQHDHLYMGEILSRINTIADSLEDDPGFVPHRTKQIEEWAALWKRRIRKMRDRNLDLSNVDRYFPRKGIQIREFREDDPKKVTFKNPPKGKKVRNIRKKEFAEAKLRWVKKSPNQVHHYVKSRVGVRGSLTKFRKKYRKILRLSHTQRISIDLWGHLKNQAIEITLRSGEKFVINPESFFELGEDLADLVPKPTEKLSLFKIVKDNRTMAVNSEIYLREIGSRDDYLLELEKLIDQVSQETDPKKILSMLDKARKDNLKAKFDLSGRVKWNFFDTYSRNLARQGVLADYPLDQRQIAGIEHFFAYRGPATYWANRDFLALRDGSKSLIEVELMNETKATFWRKMRLKASPFVREFERKPGYFTILTSAILLISDIGFAALERRSPYSKPLWQPIVDELRDAIPKRWNPGWFDWIDFGGSRVAPNLEGIGITSRSEMNRLSKKVYFDIDPMNLKPNEVPRYFDYLPMASDLVLLDPDRGKELLKKWEKSQIRFDELPEKITKIGKNPKTVFRMKSRIPLGASSDFREFSIPVPPGFKISELEIFEEIGGESISIRDLKVFRLDGSGLMNVKLGFHSGKEFYFNIGYRRAPEIKKHSVLPFGFSNIIKSEVKRYAQAVRKAGMIQLADGIDDLIKRTPREIVSILDIASVIRKEAIYGFSSSPRDLGSVADYQTLDDFDVFISKGCLSYQCNGASRFMDVSQNLYLPKPSGVPFYGNDIIGLPSFIRQGNNMNLNASGNHIRNLAYDLLNDHYLRFDVTPSGMANPPSPTSEKPARPPDPEIPIKFTQKPNLDRPRRYRMKLVEVDTNKTKGHKAELAEELRRIQYEFYKSPSFKQIPRGVLAQLPPHRLLNLLGILQMNYREQLNDREAMEKIRRLYLPVDFSESKNLQDALSVVEKFERNEIQKFEAVAKNKKLKTKLGRVSRLISSNLLQDLYEDVFTMLQKVKRPSVGTCKKGLLDELKD